MKYEIQHIPSLESQTIYRNHAHYSGVGVLPLLARPPDHDCAVVGDIPKARVPRVQACSILLHYRARYCTVQEEREQDEFKPTPQEHRSLLTNTVVDLRIILPKYLKGLFVSTKSFVTLAHISSTQPCTSLSLNTLSFSTDSIACHKHHVNCV